MVKNNGTTLILLVIFFQLVGFLLGQLTQENIPIWYHQLNKSSLTPPGFVFAVVWSFLYALLAVIAWMLFCVYQSVAGKCKLLFALQMLMNWCWTPLFFSFHYLFFSGIWLVVLTCLNGVLLLQFYKTKKLIAYLLLPYFIWLLFASYLNLAVILLN